MKRTVITIAVVLLLIALLAFVSTYGLSIGNTRIPDRKSTRLNSSHL